MAIRIILLGLAFGTSISVVSWMVGIMFNSIFGKAEFFEKISNLNFVRSKSLNRNIGLNYFKWLVTKTFFKFFNQKIRLENSHGDLKSIRNEMTLAEISHLVGFVFVVFFAVYFSFIHGLTYGLAMMIPNIFLNLYPSLLQQENKRRIDRLMERQNSR